MENLFEYNSYQDQSQPVSTETFSMSGVSDDAMKLIAGLMTKVILYSGDAETIAKMAESDKSSATDYVKQKIDSIVSDVPGIDSNFHEQIKSQSYNLAKGIVNDMPEEIGKIAASQPDQANYNKLKEDPSKISFFKRLKDFDQGPQEATITPKVS